MTIPVTSRTHTPRALAATARQLARQDHLWRPVVDFDPISRYYALLGSDPDHEAWLLTWLPGQGTAWHDHGGSSGSFVVLQGVLTEDVAGYREAVELVDVRRSVGPAVPLLAGDQRTFGRRHLHRVTNLGPDPAVSLHVYSPRLTAMNHYEDRHGALHHVGQARVGASW